MLCCSESFGLFIVWFAVVVFVYLVCLFDYLVCLVYCLNELKLCDSYIISN